VRDLGPSARPAAGLSSVDTAAIQQIFTNALGTAARIALLFAMGVVLVGAALSLLIPRGRPARRSATEEILEMLPPFEPMDVDPARI
jgi:hypothetical protein